MDHDALRAFVDSHWQERVLPTLADYIRIPNKSPAFDPQWQAHGHMDQAVALFEAWSRENIGDEMTVEVVRLPNRTPVIFVDAPATGPDNGTVLLYGHLDKQPEMAGWRDDLGPWTPVVEGERLYGRGGADDGYALFGALTAIAALRAQGINRSRCIILIESCEESGSYDLPFYLDHLGSRIGIPDLVVCLDSGCGNYDQLWCTSSLRGMVSGKLSIDILSEGVHSGDAGGVVPSSFRVLRSLLERLERASDGALADSFGVAIPPQRQQQAQAAALAVGAVVHQRFPFLDGVSPLTDKPVEAILNRTWRPAMEVIGADGIPSIQDAGNVARPGIAVKISLRLPPTLDAVKTVEQVKAILEREPPYGARVTFQADAAANGWNAPPLAAWLESSLHNASSAWFGRPALFMGEGGSIPFMALLSEKFPAAQFLVTGVLGPQSNAHGPNEFLHIPTAKAVTCCVASVLMDHCTRTGS